MTTAFVYFFLAGLLTGTFVRPRRVLAACFLIVWVLLGLVLALFGRRGMLADFIEDLRYSGIK